MSAAEVVRWVHLLAAATWTGGLITVGALVPTLRKAGVDRDQLRAMARQFARLSWGALVIAVVTGVWQVNDIGLEWSDATLSVKLTLVVVAAGLALVHQFTARRTTAAVRGAIQGLILGVSVAIFGVAVML